MFYRQQRESWKRGSSKARIGGSSASFGSEIFLETMIVKSRRIQLSLQIRCCKRNLVLFVIISKNTGSIFVPVSGAYFLGDHFLLEKDFLYDQSSEGFVLITRTNLLCFPSEELLCWTVTTVIKLTGSTFSNYLSIQ